MSFKFTQLNRNVLCDRVYIELPVKDLEKTEQWYESIGFTRIGFVKDKSIQVAANNSVLMFYKVEDLNIESNANIRIRIGLKGFEQYYDYLKTVVQNLSEPEELWPYGKAFEIKDVNGYTLVFVQNEDMI